MLSNELFFNPFHKPHDHLQHLGRDGLLDFEVFVGRTRLAMLEEMVQVGQLTQGEVGLAVFGDDLIITREIL